VLPRADKLTNPENNNDNSSSDETSDDILTQILTLLPALTANGQSTVKHIADLRLHPGNQRVGVILQQQCVGADGRVGNAGLGEWVEGLVWSRCELRGMEFEDEFCAKCDEDGWSYV